MIHQPRMCHCYACVHKRSAQGKQQKMLPDIYGATKGRGKGKAKFEFPKTRVVNIPNEDLKDVEIMTPFVIPVTVDGVDGAEETKEMVSPARKNSRAQGGPSEYMPEAEKESGKGKKSRRTLQEVLECIRRFANEEKKESNYRKRLRFKLTQRTIRIPKTNHKREQYVPDRQKIVSGSKLRRCTSMSSFVSQSYVSTEKPSVLSYLPPIAGIQTAVLQKSPRPRPIIPPIPLIPPERPIPKRAPSPVPCASPASLIAAEPRPSPAETPKFNPTVAPQPVEPEKSVAPVKKPQEQQKEMPKPKPEAEVKPKVRPPPLALVPEVRHPAAEAVAKKSSQEKLRRPVSKRTSELGSGRKKINNAVSDAALYKEPDEVVIDPAYYSHVKTRETLKQAKNNFRYENAKVFVSLGDDLFAIPASLLEPWNIIRNLAYETEQDHVKGLKLPYYPRAIFLQLCQSVIHRKAPFLAARKKYQEDNVTELQSLFDTSNEDRMDGPGMSVKSDKDDFAGRKEVRDDWYYSFVDRPEINEDEVYVERIAACILKYEDKEHPWDELVRKPYFGPPPKCRHLKNKGSIDNVCKPLEQLIKPPAIMKYMEEFSSSSDEDEYRRSALTDRGRMSSNALNPFSRGRKQTFDFASYLVLPGSEEMRSRVKSVISGESRGDSEKECDDLLLNRQNNGELPFHFQGKYKTIWRSGMALDLRGILENLASLKLDLPMLRSKKDRKGSILAGVGKTYAEPLWMLRDFSVEDEMFEHLGGNEVESESNIRMDGIKPGELHDEANAELCNRLEHVHMDTYAEFVDSGEYNNELSQTISKNFVSQWLLENYGKDVIWPANIEHIINTERVCYPFIFDQASENKFKVTSSETLESVVQENTDNLSGTALYFPARHEGAVRRRLKEIRDRNKRVGKQPKEKKSEESEDLESFHAPGRRVHSALAIISVGVHLPLDDVDGPFRPGSNLPSGRHSGAELSDSDKPVINSPQDVDLINMDELNGSYLPGETEKPQESLNVSPINRFQAPTNGNLSEFNLSMRQGLSAVPMTVKSSRNCSGMRFLGSDKGSEKSATSTTNLAVEKSIIDESKKYNFFNNKKKYAELYTCQHKTERTTRRQDSDSKILSVFPSLDEIIPETPAEERRLKRYSTLKLETIDEMDMVKKVEHVMEDRRELNETKVKGLNRRRLAFSKMMLQVPRKVRLKPEAMLFNAINRGQQNEVRVTFGRFG